MVRVKYSCQLGHLSLEDAPGKEQRSVFVHSSVTIVSPKCVFHRYLPTELMAIARMRVPKMAKNGQNSRLHVSAGFDKDRCPKKSRTDMNSKTALKS